MLQKHNKRLRRIRIHQFIWIPDGYCAYPFGIFLYEITAAFPFRKRIELIKCPVRKENGRAGYAVMLGPPDGFPVAVGRAQKSFDRLPAKQGLISGEEKAAADIAQRFKPEADGVRPIREIVCDDWYAMTAAKRSNIFMARDHDAAVKQILCRLQCAQDHGRAAEICHQLV